MSTVTNSITTCPDLQSMLNNWFITCQRVRIGSPMFQFLLSDVNTTGIQQVVNPMSNKKRTVQLVYDQPIATSEANTVSDCDRVCDATTERGDLSQDYYIDCTDGKYVEERIRTSDWNESCRDNGEVVLRTLNNMIGVLDDVMAEKTASELPPLVGAYSSDVATTDMTIDVDDFLVVATQKSGGDPDLRAFQQIDLATEMSGYCNGRFITGGSLLAQYYRIMNVSCCADNGIDGAEMLATYGQAVSYDRWVAQQFGDDVSLIFQPGSVQVLTYNATDMPLMGLNGITDLDMTYRNFFEAVIVSPATGLPIDLTIKNDCGVIHIVMTAYTKAVGLPIDMYPTGHPLEGVVYLNGVQVTNP